MKRSFLCKNKDGSEIEFEIEKFAIIKSEQAPVLCLEKTKTGKYRLCINEDFNIRDIEEIKIIRVD